MYAHKYSEELPFFQNPSNIGMSCRFLYANAGRIIAGYIRCKGEKSLIFFPPPGIHIILTMKPKKLFSFYKIFIHFLISNSYFIINAVNCHGYFLYNEQSVTLYGFDGEKRYTYKYEQKKPECILVLQNFHSFSHLQFIFHNKRHRFIC